MTISQAYAKVDKYLRAALESSSADDVLTAILMLDAQTELRPSTELDPKTFQSPVAYREALIRRRQEGLNRRLGQTMENLRAIGLVVDGGKLAPIVVVSGAAHQINAALELPSVQKAFLNRSLEVIPSLQ